MTEPGARPLLCIGIPTYCEGQVILDAVRSCLAQQDINVVTLVSERGNDWQALRIIESEISDPRVRLRGCSSDGPGTTGAWNNFAQLMTWMLDEVPEADGYALLAGDDKWDKDTGRKLMDLLSGHSNRVVVPAQVGFFEGEMGLRMAPLKFQARYRWIRKLQLFCKAQMPAMVIYGLHGPSSFRAMRENIEKVVDLQVPAPDLYLGALTVLDAPVFAGNDATLLRRYRSELWFSNSTLRATNQNCHSRDFLERVGQLVHRAWDEWYQGYHMVKSLPVRNMVIRIVLGLYWGFLRSLRQFIVFSTQKRGSIRVP